MLSLFVNGDSHTARLHGQNAMTATEILAKKYHCDYRNIALPGGSNQRIMRTTLDSLQDLDPKSTVIILGWSSFERTEWYFRDQWHQISGDADYSVHAELKDLWQQHIDSWYSNDNHECWRRQADQHHAIWMLHHMLNRLGYEFLFYQGCKTFFFDGCPQQDLEFRLPWITGTWAHDPYVRLTDNNERMIQSFSHYAELQGCTHTDNGAHYGLDAHAAWADYLDSFVHRKLQSLTERHA